MDDAVYHCARAAHRALRYIPYPPPSIPHTQLISTYTQVSCGWSAASGSSSSSSSSSTQTMMRTRLSKLAQEAKKVKLAAAPAPSGQGTGPTGGPGKTKPSTQYRILESPGCRRVALVGDKGRVDARAAESLMWKVRQGGLHQGAAGGKGGHGHTYFFVHHH